MASPNPEAPRAAAAGRPTAAKSTAVGRRGEAPISIWGEGEGRG